MRSLNSNAGTFPKPNLGNGLNTPRRSRTTDHIREDAGRIDHSINSKFQLMGHYLHDAMDKSFYPAAVERQHLPNGRHRDDQSVLYGGH